jgi:hypothetical protein
MKTRIHQTLLVISLFVSGIAYGAETNDLALSLRQRIEKGEVVLDILVSNVSTSAVEVVSSGFAPAWSVDVWFKWEVDGKQADYSESVASIFDAKDSWRIPRHGVVLWATIPLRSLKHLIKHEQGRGEWHSVIQDTNRHLIVILPNTQWKNLKVRPGKLEIGQETANTSPAAGADQH